MIKKYTRRPPAIEAMRWDASKPYEGMKRFKDFACPCASFSLEGESLPKLVFKQYQNSLEYFVEDGDFVMKDQRGDLTACKPKQFLEHYEEVK